MKLSRQVLYGVFTVLMSMLQSMYASFYVDSFVRHHLTSGSYTAASPPGTRGAALLAAAQEAAELARNTSGDTITVQPHVDHLPWGTLVGLAVAQVGYTAWATMHDLGFSSAVGARLRVSARRRLARLSVSGPLWALFFVLLWLPLRLPWVPVPFVFTLVMAGYEGVGSSCATAAGRLLLVESPGAHARERDRGAGRALALRAFGSAGVVVASVLYEAEAVRGLTEFRLMMLLWGVVAGCGFFAVSGALSGNDCGEQSAVGGQSGSSPPQRERGGSPCGAGFSSHSPGSRRPESMPSGAGATGPESSSLRSTLQRFWSIAGQTLGRPSMRALMGMWALQEFSSAVATNFLSLFLALLCSRTMAPSVRAVALLLSFLVPPALTVALTPLQGSVGKKHIVSVLLLMRLCVGVAVLLLSLGPVQETVRDAAKLDRWKGPQRTAVSTADLVGRTAAKGSQAAAHLDHTASAVFAILIFLNRVLTEVVSGMQCALLSDVCDEDTIIFGRARPMSATIHGLVGLMAKPCQAAALLVTAAALVSSGALSKSAFSGEGAPAKESALVAAYIGCSVTVTAGAALVVWQRQYQLDGKHLQFIQMAMRKRAEDEEVEQV